MNLRAYPKLRVPMKGKLKPLKYRELYMDNYEFYAKYRRVLNGIYPDERRVYRITLDADTESWAVYSGASAHVGSSFVIVLITALFGFVASNFRNLDGVGSRILLSLYLMVLIGFVVHYFSLRYTSHVKGKAKLLKSILDELETLEAPGDHVEPLTVINESRINVVP